MEKSGGDWGIVGVSLRNSDTADALRPQGWAYTSLALSEEREETRVISVLNGVLVAPDNPEAVLTIMCDPLVKIVSLTVTEKGYCHHPATGGLNIDHPDIQYDLTHPEPRTAIGYLVGAFQRRRDAGHAPFTVLSCDNLPSNGALSRLLVLEFANEVDPELADWIATYARFPSTMVDRITPATTADDIARVAKITGYQDKAPVLHEPFSQWAIEDDFVDHQRPDFSAAGAQMVADVSRHEEMKLRLLNGTHSALAYTGYLAGYKTISQTVGDPVFSKFLRKLWSEITPSVDAPQGVNLSDYTDALYERYANSAIQHKTWQIAMDGSQKIPQRILGTMRENLDAGRDISALCLSLAAWMRYVDGCDDAGNVIDLRDPMAEMLIAQSQKCDDPQGKVEALLSISDIFDASLANQIRILVADAYVQICQYSTRGAIKKCVD
ncbi:UNVERIFIED_CONTAM: hypothetical protein GTU68_030022 [Idotea baltica]|nr:hypothetical protein [Idotea baltica]